MRQSKEELIRTCLSRLGSPVINIDLAETQILDAVEESIDYWNRNHCDGAENINIGLDLDEVDYRGMFSLAGLEDTIIGVNSVHHSKGGVSMSSLIDKYINYIEPKNDNVIIDPVTGKNKRKSTHVNGSFQDKTSYTEMLEKNLARQQLGHHGNSYSFHGSGNGVKLYNRSSTTTGESVISRVLMIRRNLSELNALSKYVVPFEFNNSTQCLNINDSVGQFMVANCIVAVDPEVYPQSYNNEWLTNYATAKIQMYWGRVLSKFTGIGSLGDIKIDGAKILLEANKEIEKLEKQARASQIYNIRGVYI